MRFSIAAVIRLSICGVALICTGLALTSARAELILCNRTSYRLEAAIGLEKRVTIATRGWFRVDPGDCRQVAEGAVDTDMVYLHVRTPPTYGSAPMPPGRVELCLRDGDFEIANARGCPVNEQAHSAPRIRPTRLRVRRSIWRKKPTITTRKPALLAFSGC